MVGGARSVAMGGNIQDGLISGLLNEAASHAGVHDILGSGHAQHAIMSSMVAGTVSEVTGGSFEEGAILGGMQYSMNHLTKEIKSDLYSSNHSWSAFEASSDNGSNDTCASGGQNCALKLARLGSGSIFPVLDKTKRDIKLFYKGVNDFKKMESVRLHYGYMMRMYKPEMKPQMMNKDSCSVCHRRGNELIRKPKPKKRLLKMLER